MIKPGFSSKTGDSTLLRWPLFHSKTSSFVWLLHFLTSHASVGRAWAPSNFIHINHSMNDTLFSSSCIQPKKMNALFQDETVLCVSDKKNWLQLTNFFKSIDCEGYEIHHLPNIKPSARRVQNSRLVTQTPNPIFAPPIAREGLSFFLLNGAR